MVYNMVNNVVYNYIYIYMVNVYIAIENGHRNN